MSTENIVNLYRDCIRQRWLDAFGWYDKHRQNLVRNRIYLLRLHLLDAQDLDDVALDENGHAADAFGFDASDLDTLLTALKTEADWSESGDFTAAWNGFALDDTGHHDPAKGRLSQRIKVLSAVDAGDYRLEFNGVNGDGSFVPFDHNGEPLDCLLLPDLATGDEAGLPAGLPAVTSGTGIIAEGLDTVDVAIPGLLAASSVLKILQQQPAAGGLTILTPGIADGILTVTAGQEAPAGGWKFYYEVKL